MTAPLLHSLQVFSDGSIVEKPTRPPLWTHLEDKAAQGYIRSCAPCPAVWTLKDDPQALLGEQWQYYLRAINHNMTLENVYLLMDDHLAFANDTGFNSLDNPGRADYFFRRDLGEKPPALNKVRTCSRNVLTGTVVGDKLRVTLFDSRQPPPLKTGRAYPSRVEDVKLDDYLYRPETHPWLFMTANIVNRAGEVVQFPRGAVYPWTGDSTIRSFLPHIANFEYGDVLYPLSRLRRLGESEAVPSPYRST
jgi:hypothetical protein